MRVIALAATSALSLAEKVDKKLWCSNHTFLPTRPTVMDNTTLSLRIGTECSGICALSAALDRLHVAVDYVFA